MPNLFDLKSLYNLKYVYEQYLKVINKHRNPKYWKPCPCPICKTYSSSDSAKNLSIDGFYYFTCPECKNVYNSIQLIISLNKLYNLYRDKLVKPSKKLREQFCLRKYQEIQQYFKYKGKLLDVGCGEGELLNVFGSSGWITTGIDPYINKSFEEYLPYGRFDCITFFGVLEHINNPIELLKNAVGLLEYDGLIVFEVPSADCLLMQYLRDNSFSPYRFIEHTRHLSFFSKYTIDYICDILNIKIVDIKTVGFDLQTLFLKEYPSLIKMQDILDRMLLSDHYRVFLKRK